MTQPIEQPRTSGGRVLDQVVAWSLYAIQLLSEVLLALFALTSVFMTDSCGSVEDEPAVCDSGYFATVLLGYWAILALAAVAVPIVLVVCTRKERLLWPWALGSLVLLGGLTVAFVMLMTR